ncbi:MAG: acetyltransferase [Alphaproteobacteria bacterium]|nr:acetyltransferase [Alphaproteobacteria bacterium]
MEMIFWGGRGHAKVLAEIVRMQGSQVCAVFDNNSALESPLEGVPMHYGMDGFSRWLGRADRKGSVGGIAAIGGMAGPARCEFLKLFRHYGIPTPSLVHPEAYLAPSVTLGDNCHVLAMAVVCADACLGEATIVNTKASVDHECQIGDGVHVAPGATICGCVEVGRFSMVGAGAIVLPRVRIGEGALIGAGAIVTQDIPDGVVAYGQPARIVRKI